MRVAAAVLLALMVYGCKTDNSYSLGIVVTVVVIGFIALAIYNDQMLSRRKKAFLKTIGAHELYNGGKYLSGHPNINIPQEVDIALMHDGLTIVPHVLPKEVLGVIKNMDIKDVLIEDASTIEKRVTATRLVTLGLFAFAAKKTERSLLYYLTITWDSNKFTNETVLEFETAAGLGAANKLNAAIRNILNVARGLDS